MAKISPVSIKYTIYAKFTSEGPVEKPDVIGALFGQTEGLLGSELEMRELQKEGKIGRIEVSLESKDGKTIGEIEIPSALDKAETSLIAAAIETIDRIGPTDAKIEVQKIDDVRGSKRDFIIERAKKLLEQINGSADTKEIATSIKEGARINKIQQYGEERLPAGDLESDEIIIVEGRADVINLLRNNIKNVIGMDGTKLPETIKELSYDKEATLFIDGDRGGKLIAKNVCNNARIDYIASAPEGKEVEELTGKEILNSLRKKVRAEEFFKEKRRGIRGTRREKKVETEEVEQEKKLTANDKKKLKELMEKLPNKSALLLDENLNVIKKVASGSISSALKRTKKVFVVLTNSTVTNKIVKAVEEANVTHLAAKNFAYTDTEIDLISL